MQETWWKAKSTKKVAQLKTTPQVKLKEQVKEKGKAGSANREFELEYAQFKEEKSKMVAEMLIVKQQLTKLQGIAPEYKQLQSELEKMKKQNENLIKNQQQESVVKDELRIVKEHNKVLKEQVQNFKLFQKQMVEKHENSLKANKSIQVELDEKKLELSKLKDENKLLTIHQVTLRTQKAELKTALEAQTQISKSPQNEDIEIKYNKQIKDKNKEILTLKENCKSYEAKLESLVTELMSKERVSAHLCDNLETLKFVNKELELKVKEMSPINGKVVSKDSERRQSIEASSETMITLDEWPSEPVKHAAMESESEEETQISVKMTEDLSHPNRELEDGKDDTTRKGEHTQNIKRAEDGTSTLSKKESANNRSSAKECVFYRRGECKFGEDCWYSHSTNGTDADKKQAVCRHYQRGYCSFGDKCRFMHSNKTNQLKDNELNREKRPCKFYLQGYCKNGNKCMFEHKGRFNEMRSSCIKDNHSQGQNKDAESSHPNNSYRKDEPTRRIEKTAKNDNSKNEECLDLKEITRMIWALKDLVEKKQQQEEDPKEEVTKTRAC